MMKEVKSENLQKVIHQLIPLKFLKSRHTISEIKEDLFDYCI